MTKKFNESQNGIVVEAQSQVSYEDIVTKLVAAVPAKKQPALAQMDLMFIPHFIEMGVLEPLDAYLSAADKDAFIPSFLQQATYKGFPLYYWINDKQRGDTTGEKVGGVWFAIDPAKFPPTM